MEQYKMRFLSVLADLLAGRNEASGVDLLKAIFVYCSNCNRQNIPPASLFTTEERRTTDKQIIDSIPLLRRDLKEVARLGWESAMKKRIARSGLEFIRENFAADNSWLSYELEEMLMLSEEVKDLDSHLAAYDGQRGEYDNGEDCVDLRGVPESHSWWCADERGDSVRRFGS